MQLTFTVNGLVQLDRNIRLLVTNMQQLGDFFKDAINLVASRSDELFAATGSNVEKAPSWPPLSPRTQHARDMRWGYYKRAPNRPTTLRWTGNLQDNRTIYSDDKQGKLTFNAPYAIYHQAGGGTLPRRVVVDLSNATNVEIVRALQVFVNTQIGIFGRQI